MTSTSFLVSTDTLREAVRIMAKMALLEMGYSDDPGIAPVPHGEDSNTGIEVDASVANKLSHVLASLGVKPETVVKSEDPGVNGEAEISEEAMPGEPPVPGAALVKTPRAKKKKVTPTAEPDAPPKEPKWAQHKGSFKVDIDQETIEAAKKFYEAGQIGADWYFNANKAITEGFSSEQDRVLFALLLASTSVQNEIYTNFIEAGALFNAIKRDQQENPDLLMKFANDSNLNLGDQNLLSHSEYGNLHVFKDTKTLKITSVGAKFGNIRKTVGLFLKGQLTVDVVRNAIAGSVKPGPLGFDRRNPLLRKMKIANYALTLVDPAFASSKENWFNVVVDTWMFRIFYPGANKAMVDKLFGSELAYTKVAKVVSDLAAEAGVSPHVMQAALWTGIKRSWEGPSADVSNYVSAVERLTTEYKEFWEDMDRETKSLADVISRLSPEVAGKIIAKKRADFGKALGAKSAARHAAKRAASSAPPAPEVSLVERVRAKKKTVSS